jgi:hypothetical protein
VTDVF